MKRPEKEIPKLGGGFSSTGGRVSALTGLSRRKAQDAAAQARQHVREAEDARRSCARLMRNAEGEGASTPGLGRLVGAVMWSVAPTAQ
jgi:hypothetical protein